MSETKNINPVETLRLFMHRKTVQEADMEQEAQRLVNLFRHLSVFGDDFIETFNHQLLSAPKEVIMLLPTIVGGSLVRQYAEYLSRQMGLTTENREDTVLSQGDDGYLPGPENDIPFVTAMAAGVTPAAVGTAPTTDTIDAVQKIIETQGQLFADTLEKITTQTRESAVQQTAEIARLLSAHLSAEPAAAQATAPAMPVSEPSDVDVVAAELMPTSDSHEIPTVIAEMTPPAYEPPYEASDDVFAPDDDIEILSEIDLPNN